MNSEEYVHPAIRELKTSTGDDTPPLAERILGAVCVIRLIRSGMIGYCIRMHSRIRWSSGMLS